MFRRLRVASRSAVAPRNPNRTPWWLHAAAVLATAIAVLATAGGALALDQDARWSAEFFPAGLDGEVRAVASSGTDLYVGGDFRVAGRQRVEHIARWDGSQWLPLGDGIDGTVYALAVVGGDVYAAGHFFKAGDASVKCIARWDGTSWSDVGGGVSNFSQYGPGAAIYAMATDGSSLFVGGYFDRAGSLTSDNLARWDGQAWSSIGRIIGFAVHALLFADGKLTVGGNFQEVRVGASQLPVHDIAQWNGSTWDDLGGGITSPYYTSYGVSALAIYDSKLVAGGGFRSIGESTVNSVATWDGTYWLPLDTGITSSTSAEPVSALAVANGSLYAAGRFSEAGNTAAANVARWDGESWSAAGSGVSGFVEALAAYDGGIVAGGSFTVAGGQPAAYLAHVVGDAWNPFEDSPNAGGIPGIVSAIETMDEQVFAGGDFAVAGTTLAQSLAMRSAGNWEAIGDVVGTSNVRGKIEDLARDGGGIVAGGTFASIGDVAAKNVARWDGSAWSALGIGLNRSASTVAAGNGLVYAAIDSGFGFLQTWDGQSWTPFGNFNGTPDDLAVTDGGIVVGGGFSYADGPADHAARWDGQQWSGAPSHNLDDVYAVAPHGEGVFIGGRRASLYGPLDAMLNWTDQGVTPVGIGSNRLLGVVYSLVRRGDDLFAGGYFRLASNDTYINVAKWDGEQWKPLGSGIEGVVLALAATDEGLYAGGDFSLAGGKPSANFAFWKFCGNGELEAGEDCDDANTDESDCCLADCSAKPAGTPCAQSGNVCIESICDDAGTCGVDHVGGCDDGLLCNGADICTEGDCVHAGNGCKDDDWCTFDRCNEQQGCSNDPIEGCLASTTTTTSTVVDVTVTTVTSTSTTTTTELPDCESFTGLAVGPAHVCVLDEEGRASCWGRNEAGQARPPARTFESLVAGPSRSCGFDGELLRCWGSGPPAPSEPLASVSLSDGVACAVRAGDQSIVCWGYNEYGLHVPPPGEFLQVTVGGSQACALKPDGNVFCWGLALQGRLEPPASNFVSISAGQDHTCGIRTDGALECWGWGPLGQLEAPEGSFVAISAGREHNCAIRDDGDVLCWGNSFEGQLEAPAGSFVAVSSSLDTSCGLRSSGKLECWGSNGRFLEDTIPGQQWRDVEVGGHRVCAIHGDGHVSCWGQLYDTSPKPGPPAGGNFVSMDGGDLLDCAMTPLGYPNCWGTNQNDALSVPPGPFRSISIGRVHGCGVRFDNTIDCWGADWGGGPPPGEWAEVAAGTYFTCARSAEGDVQCWGTLDTGVTGEGIRQITAGIYDVCGIREDGSVLCWGVHSDIVAPAGVTFSRISAAIDYVCGLHDDGTAECWNGSPSEELSYPPPGSFVDITAGSYSGCAIDADRSIECWGLEAMRLLGTCGIYTSCGNGNVDDGEDCDDGDVNRAPGDACDSFCRLAACGKPLRPGRFPPAASDALYALRSAVGSTSCSIQVCDVDRNGSATANDALQILRVAVGIAVPAFCAG